MKEFIIRILISTVIFGMAVIPVFLGTAYPLLFLVMVGFLSTVIGNVIADCIFK